MTRLYTPPPDTPIRVYIDDPYLLVVEKPSGLLTVPGRGVGKADCLLSRIRNVYPDALIVHRLDMETSGLVVLARNRDVHRALSHAFERREVAKGYHAVVSGRLPAETGQICLPLIADWPNRPRQKIDETRGKPSETRWTCLDANQDSSRVWLEPVTGRSHQLRVHLNAIGHPILGDSLYGTPDSMAAAPRLMLHATRLGFQHPVTHDRVDVTHLPAF